MTISEKASYLKGLMDGMKYDVNTNEGKLFSSIIDLLEDIASSIEDLDEEQVALSDYVEEIDDDLAAIEEDFYDEELPPPPHHHFDDCCCDCDDYDDDDDDEDDDEDNEWECNECGCGCDECDECGCEECKVLTCPECGEEIYVDRVYKKLSCPSCNAEFFPVYEDDNE